MGGGGDTFLQQFMAGWQMGQQRREGQRRDQMMMVQQQQQAQQAQADAQERAARIEALKLQKDRIEWERKKEEFDLKLRLGQVTSKQTQVLPPQTEDLGGGTQMEMGPMTAPTPPIMADIPGGGQVQVPFYEDVAARKLAEEQARMREALNIRNLGQKTPEEIFAEAKARAAGERAGAPPVGPREPQGSWAEAIGPDGKPILFNATTSEVKPFPSGVQPKPKAPKGATGAQQKALKFYEQMADALANVERPIGKDANAPTLEDAIAKSGTVKQWWMGVAAPALLTPEQRRYVQAAKLFTESRLRNVSGAAVPPYEYKTDLETYFVQPGDDPVTIAQKRQSRQTVLNALKKEAGPAYTEFYGGPEPGETAIDPAVVEALKELGFAVEN